MSLAPDPVKIGLGRLFTSQGVDPYDEVVWERRDARITNRADGSVAFEQLGVEFPADWSQNATNIVAQKYFRGALDAPERESSLRQVVDRVVDTITRWGLEGGYFSDDAEASAFSDELKYILVTQRAAFNSPVWFNIGVPGVRQQASACFILEVDDTMDSILNWYREEGIIFKGGSGAGTNLSQIRSSRELLNGGGTASGPVSFMRGADASAGTIKSGGKTRRAAKMVVLNVDHPDIEEFIWCKALEERKVRVLREAGFDMDLDGRDAFSVQYQNANNSVRVTDEFMQAVVSDADWELTAVTTGEVVRTVRAADLWRQIAAAAWECADPGIQFDTTINRWHTAANTGRINASNPCAEHMHLDNSACNLASINLLEFLDDDRFDVDAFRHTVEMVFTAQEILVGRADYPTETIAENAHDFRQLGLGYTNLGALLMALGLPYDSHEGRAWAAAITSLLTAHAYATSARTAARMGPFGGFAVNEEHMLRVLRMHRDAGQRHRRATTPSRRTSSAPPARRGRRRCATARSTACATRKRRCWRRRARSASCSIATRRASSPTSASSSRRSSSAAERCRSSTRPCHGRCGTSATTRPRSPTSSPTSTPTARSSARRTSPPSISRCSPARWATTPSTTRVTCACWRPCSRSSAVRSPRRPTCPRTSRSRRSSHLHQLAWELGLKSIAIYRDNCKVGQPLSTTQCGRGGPDRSKAPSSASSSAIVEKVVHRPVREKLPRSRKGRTFEFRVADCKGFATIGEYDDGRPGEVFLTVSKQGSTLAGIMDAFAKSISYGLQYGVPLRAFVEAFTNMRFEPAGMTDDPEIRFASSVMDYLFRKLAMEYMTYEERAELSIFSVSERMQPTLPGLEEGVVETSSGSEMVSDPKSLPSAERSRRPAQRRHRPAGAARQHARRRCDSPSTPRCACSAA